MRVCRSWIMAALAIVVAAAGCAREAKPDAYGNVEAQEVEVAAEVTGRVRSLHAVDGGRLEAGAGAAVIETTQLDLERAQVETQQAAAAARVHEATELADVARARQRAQAAERDVLVPQREIAERAYARTRRLYEQAAATAQQLDQAERDLRVVREQIEARTSQIAVEREQVQAAEARVQSARTDVTSAAARLAQITARVADAEVRNPAAGTVLTTYVRAGEFVQAGQRLYTIASLDAMDVRVYVTEPQLAAIRLGQAATVTVDAGTDRLGLPGTVTWIAPEAEFTPTPIQTRDERANLVYAVKIRVANEGQVLKIGMPVDVVFAPASR